MSQIIRKWAEELRVNVLTLWYAYKNPLCPFIVKLLIGFIVLYALSPIDLIPDFIPIIGYLDEIILLPILIAVAIHLLPNAITQEAKIQAITHLQEETPKPKLWLGGLVILCIWIVLITWLGHLLIPKLLGD
jgi:uncharacterized membrane protein YkvA (DUF1232 family)